MKVTYLGHSGFLVETERAYYLFDYIRGELPVWKDGLPLYVFSSHSHEDHFCTGIFAPELAARVTAYILSYDIGKKFRRSRAGWLRENGERILWAEPGKKLEPETCRILPLKSTDLGVAFVVEEEDICIYHAGDLNWWHWEGESKAWNRNMEVNYRREIDRLAGRRMKLAFVPLDPRLGDAYWYGMEYFLRTVSAETVFPMHFWEDYTVIPRYIAEHGKENNIIKIEREGQQYEI